MHRVEPPPRALRATVGGLECDRCARDDESMSPTPTISSYEEARSAHRWEVPERYNIAADVCDRHPRDKLAMLHEHHDGTVREVTWGELQDTSNRFANVLTAHGVTAGDRVAMLLPATPETAAAFFGTWKVGAILLSMSVLYGNDGIRHRLTDSQAKVLVTNEANADRMERSLVEHLLLLDDELLGHGSTAFHCSTPPPTTRPALLLVGHHRAGQGHPPCPPLHPRPRGVHLLPRRPGRRAVPRDGRVGVGGRDLPADRSLASRRGAGRLPA